MKRLLTLGWLVVVATTVFSHAALAQRAKYEEMITTHAKANLVPEDLVHRVIIRESKYQAALLGSGGAIGLMQIKLATAKGVGYAGNAEGLRDPETNLAYGVKYLAGAYRAAGGDYDRAIRYFAGGYYYVAKQQRLDHLKHGKADLNAAPPKVARVEDMPAPPSAEVVPADDVATSADTGKTEDTLAKPAEAPVKLVPAQPKPVHAAKAKTGDRTKKKLADAKVPRPPVAIPSGANGAKPR